MLGYQRFVILFYLYLFIKKGNASVLSGTPCSCIFVLLTGKHEAMKMWFRFWMCFDLFVLCG